MYARKRTRQEGEVDLPPEEYDTLLQVLSFGSFVP